MTTWPKDNMASLIAFYGDPRGRDARANPVWEARNLVQIKPPFQMYYTGKPIKVVTVHRLCRDAFNAAFNDIWTACGKDQAKVDKSGASDYAGVYNLRVIAGTQRLSNHSFACAIDLSPKTNGFYVKKTTLSTVVIDAFKAQGARWGGDYKGRKDPMHFEFVS